MSPAPGRLEELTDKMLCPPMPECLGFDLADPEVCHSDAGWWLATRDPGAEAPVVVGIRTGGSYLAPMWAARIAAGDGHLSYTTVRPLTRRDRSYSIEELAPVRAACVGGRDVVIVDDQADTGATVMGLASALSGCGTIWTSSPGRIQLIEGGKRRALRRVTPLRDAADRRLWQLLLPEQHPRLITRLLEHVPDLEGDPRDLEIGWRVRGLAARYEGGHCWRAWNHPEVPRRPRHLVNPHKTPFVLRSKGEPVVHARFMGESLFGREEFARVQSCDLLQPPVWYLDGYLLSRHLQGLRSFRSVYQTSDQDGRRRLRQQVAQYWRRLFAGGTSLDGRWLTRPLRAEMTAALDALRAKRLDGGPVPTWPTLLVPAQVGGPGGTGRLLRSSLIYSHPGWHWQVAPEGRVLRFHADASWGNYYFRKSQLSCLELEVASFLLETRFPISDVPFLMAELADLASSQDLARLTLERLGEAVLLWVRTWFRSLRHRSPEAATLVRADLRDMWDYLELAASSPGCWA